MSRTASRMNSIMAPSLARRVTLALLVAFGIVWCVLLAMDFWSFKQAAQNRTALRSATQALADSVAGTSAAEAKAIVQASDLQFNRSRRRSGLDGIDDLKFLLEGADGGVLYASAGIQRNSLTAAKGSRQLVTASGRIYWSDVQTGRPWRVTLLEPVVSDALVLRWISEQQLVPMLIAFPLVLLPVWLAVRRGLRPLRELATRVASRDPLDVSPLALDLRHAELRPLETAFDELLTKTRRGLARERAFVQDAAHELRTPLAVIAVQAHALSEAGNPDQVRNAKAALERAVGRASHLVHQLLTLALVERAPSQRSEAVEVVELTRQVLILLTPLAAERRIEISLDSPDRLEGSVDLESFHSIVDNLLRNALAYCLPGGRIEVRLGGSGGQVTLEVRDDGPGIPAHEREQVFERFHRGRDVQSSGSGLGLAIVREAAQSMGGTVTLGDGIDGKGASFRVELGR
ncbi:MAG: sensor histidine kinase [Steroidobacteraceae bacterium]|nr:sensor histidine kinase [Steroidobacteraceae bacterium]